MILLLLLLLIAIPAAAEPTVHYRGQQAGTWERRAAEDLAHYLTRLGGRRVRLFQGPPSAGTEAFVVGELALELRPELRERLGQVLDPSATLRSDAITAAKDGPVVFLAGSNDDSHYFAVSWFLHQQGCRWYLPTELGEHVPSGLTALDTSALPHTYAAPFEVRTYWISWLGDSTGYEEFARRNFYNLVRDPVPSHALGNLMPKEPGSLLSSETVNQVADQLADRHARSEPLSLGISDAVQRLSADQDRRLAGDLRDKFFFGSAVSDLYLAFYNRICQELWRRNPESASKLSFLAYTNLTLPPQRAITAAAPLIAYLAPIDIDPSHALDDPRSPERLDLLGALRRWVEVMEGRVIIYDYDQGMMVWRDLPNPSHAVFARDVKTYRDLGILGFATESRNALATTFTNLFFRGQLMWNPELDVEGELARFYGTFYGPAGPAMAGYWGAIYQAWANQTVLGHEFPIIPAIYTPNLVSTLEGFLSQARQTSLDPLREKRLLFAELGFEVLKNYVLMVETGASGCRYAEAAAFGEKGLAARERLTELSGLFTTYERMGEKGAAWWPGEVELYRQLAALGEVVPTPLSWEFRPDPHDEGIWRNWASSSSGAWRRLRVDLLPRGQGLFDSEFYSPEGFGWYRCTVNLTRAQAERATLVFPGLFNDSWLYVNGHLVDLREQKEPWWHNDYAFRWDVDLAGHLRPGPNTLVLRTEMRQHFSGMFRRPFLDFTRP